jgi:hypothetical protein
MAYQRGSLAMVFAFAREIPSTDDLFEDASREMDSVVRALRCNRHMGTMLSRVGLNHPFST